MRRDPGLYLDDILEAVKLIREYTRGLDAEACANDPKTRDAVIRNLGIIGEGARNLPEEWTERSPSVDWRKIVGLRNVLGHAYFGVPHGAKESGFASGSTAVPVRARLSRKQVYWNLASGR